MDRTTEILAEFACSLRYTDLTRDVVHQVKRTLVDTLACGIGGFSAEPSVIARRLAEQVSSTAPARILGTRQSTSADMAAFANGVMVRYLDCSDSYIAQGSGHPSDMISAILAAAEPVQADGESIITAIVLAYEIFCRLCDESPLAGWDQGMFGVVGAACGAGKVMGLDREAMAQAISLAVTPNVPLGVTRVGHLSMWKGCAMAASCRAGVFAAQLAREGMTGPSEPFDGGKGLWEQAIRKPVELDRLGVAPLRIMATSFKYFPSQVHTQGPIGLALELRPQLDGAEIESIRIRTHGVAVESSATESEKWDPQNRETADHSMPFLVAVALRDGEVTPATFATERVQDPTLRPLIGKMTIDEDPEYTRAFPNEGHCLMEIATTDGKQLVAETRYPKGHRGNPLSDEEIETKFRQLSAGLLTETQCRDSLGQVWSFDRAKDVGTLFDAIIVSA